MEHWALHPDIVSKLCPYIKKLRIESWDNDGFSGGILRHECRLLKSHESFKTLNGFFLEWTVHHADKQDVYECLYLMQWANNKMTWIHVLPWGFIHISYCALTPTCRVTLHWWRRNRLSCFGFRAVCVEIITRPCIYSPQIPGCCLWPWTVSGYSVTTHLGGNASWN